MTRRTLLPALLAILVGASPAHAWTWPADGPVLQRFTFDANPYVAGLHRGIDVAAPAGTPVRAPAAGTVSFAGTVPRHGRTVTIQTADGYAVTLVQLGGVAVSRGSPVAEGAVVGTIGPTGEAEHSVPYVHLGVRVAAEPEGYVDPLLFLPPRELPPGVSEAGGGASAGADGGVEPVAAGGAATPEGVDGAVEPDERAAATAPSAERGVALPEAATSPVGAAAEGIEEGAAEGGAETAPAATVAIEADAATEASEPADDAPGAAADTPEPAAAAAPGLGAEASDVAAEETGHAAAEDAAHLPAETPSEAGGGEQAAGAIDVPAPLSAEAPVPVGPNLAGESTSPVAGPLTEVHDARPPDGQGDNAAQATVAAVAPAPAGALPTRGGPPTGDPTEQPRVTARKGDSPTARTPTGGDAADGRGVSRVAPDAASVDERSDVRSAYAAAGTGSQPHENGGGTRWLAAAALALATLSMLLALSFVRRNRSATRRRPRLPAPRRAAAATRRDARVGERGVARMAPTTDVPLLEPLAPPAESSGDVEPTPDEPDEACGHGSSPGLSRGCLVHGRAHRAPCRAGEALGTRSRRLDAVACEREARRRPRRLVGLAAGRRRRDRHSARWLIGNSRSPAGGPDAAADQRARSRPVALLRAAPGRGARLGHGRPRRSTPFRSTI